MDSSQKGVSQILSYLKPFIEEAVDAAEILFGPGTGQEKKEFVKSQVSKLINTLIDQLAPDIFEPIIHRVVEVAVDFMIDAAAKKLFPHDRG